MLIPVAMPRIVMALMTATCVHVAAGQAPPPGDTAVRGAGPRILRVSAGVVLAATVAQVSNSPDAWPRTTEGFARRLADQSGFVAIRALSHQQLSRVIPWTASVEPCPTRIAARAWCAVTQTLVVHDRDGAPRPDVARVGSVAIASLGSLLWRPERASRGDAGVFVVSRVTSGLLVAALRRGLTTRRGKALPD